MNRQLPPAEYVSKGEKIEKSNLDAIKANLMKGKIYDPVLKRYHEEKDVATPEEMSPSSGVEVSLNSLGLNHDEDWGWSAFISKGVPKIDNEFDLNSPTLMMGVSKDEKAIMVLYMDKTYEVDGTGLNLPKQLFNSGLMHQGYMGTCQEPKEPPICLLPPGIQQGNPTDNVGCAQEQKLEGN